MEPAAVKDVWKSATIMLGALSVMIHGLSLMPTWPADSWDSETVVRELFYFSIISGPALLYTLDRKYPHDITSWIKINNIVAQ